MRKSLILFFYTPLILLAQWSGNVLNADGTFTNATDWGLQGTARIDSGTVKLVGDGTTGNQFNDLNLIHTFALNDTALLQYEVISNTLNTSENSIYGNYFLFRSGIYYSADVLTIGRQKIIIKKANTDGNDINFRTLTTATSGTLEIDNVTMRHKLDTLYIATSGDNSNLGDSGNPVATLTEAFETRGAHSGGTFIISAGSYAESITIDNGFSKLKASGPATVTAIDFNGVTCTVDLANLIIGTKLNDGNVTYLNAPSQRKSFPGWEKAGFPKFKN